jgi:hypothetical protein
LEDKQTMWSILKSERCCRWRYVSMSKTKLYAEFQIVELHTADNRAVEQTYCRSDKWPKRHIVELYICKMSTFLWAVLFFALIIAFHRRHCGMVGLWPAFGLGHSHLATSFFCNMSFDDLPFDKKA